MNSSFAQPQQPIDKDRGSVINVIAWVVLVIASLATAVKVISKGHFTRKLQVDDILVLLALLTAVGYTIAVNQQVSAGLGRHVANLEPTQIASYGKAEYASQFLYVASIGLAKMALLHFMLSLSLTRRRITTFAALAFTLATTVFGIVVVAFQCSLPQPWNTLQGRCINQVVFWQAFGGFDILTDLITSTISIYLLHDLQIRRRELVIAIVAFMSRLLLIPAVVVRILFLPSAYDASDRPYESYHLTIITIVLVGTSIICSCAPFLRPVMENLQSGVTRGDIRTRYDRSSHDYSLEDTPKHSNPRSLRVWPKRASHFPSHADDGVRSSPSMRQRDPEADERLIIKHTSVCIQFQDQLHPL